MGTTLLRGLAALAVTSSLSVAGCATTDPANVTNIAQPDTPPQAAHTRFQESLVCMDDMFADYGVSNVTIAVSGVPDHTGRVFVGSDTWLQAAMNKMSQRSRAFVVTDYNPNPYATEQALFTMVRDNQRFYVPAYYIRGAISGFADNVASDNAAFAIGSPMYDGGAAANRSFSTVSVDLNVGDLVARTLIARAQAGNEVVLQSRGVGAQFGGRFTKLGADFEISATQADGIPQAVRMLIEVGAVEIAGRLTGAPYWECLGADGADPDVARIRSDIHANMTPAERVVFTQRRLFALGYYAGVLNGQASADLDAAIARYAGDRGIAAAPADDLQLYASLTEWNKGQTTIATAAAPGPATVEAAPQVELPAPAEATPVEQLQFQLFLFGASAPGKPVRVDLSSNKTAFAYCYLEDASGTIARVFPNRWQPNAMVQEATPVSLPSEEAGFELVAPVAGVTERVICFGSDREIVVGLPPELQREDLTPLPIRGLEELRRVFQDEAQKQAGQLTITEQIIGAPAG